MENHSDISRIDRIYGKYYFYSLKQRTVPCFLPGYYTLLRWITCIASILVAFQAFEKGIDWAKVVFIVIAILFNPLAPIYLSRSTWIPIDIITAIFFIFVIRII